MMTCTRKPKTFSELLALYASHASRNGGTGCPALADDLDVDYGCARKMIDRGTVAPWHLPRLRGAVLRRFGLDISLDELSVMATQARLQAAKEKLFLE